MKIIVAKIVASLAILATLLGCESIREVGDQSSYLTISGNKYRKTGATNADILWAGVKRDSGRNSYDPKFLPILKTEITARKVTEAFNERTREAAVEAAAKAGLDLADADVKAGFESKGTRVGTFQVFTLFDVNNFVAELNSKENSAYVQQLSRYSDPRIITSVAVVFGQKSTNNINSSGNLTLKIKNEAQGNPELSIKSTSNNTTIAKLSDGTIFAYEYARICWEKIGGKISINTIEVDRPGMDDDCPTGTTDNASKL